MMVVTSSLLKPLVIQICQMVHMKGNIKDRESLKKTSVDESRMKVLVRAAQSDEPSRMLQYGHYSDMFVNNFGQKIGTHPRTTAALKPLNICFLDKYDVTKIIGAG